MKRRRKHLLEGVPVSGVREERGLRPTVFCRWQKQSFEQGAVSAAQCHIRSGRKSISR